MPSIEVTFWMPAGSVSVSCWALTVATRKQQSREAQNSDFVQTENLVISNMSIQSVNGYAIELPVEPHLAGRYFAL